MELYLNKKENLRLLIWDGKINIILSTGIYLKYLFLNFKVFVSFLVRHFSPNTNWSLLVPVTNILRGDKKKIGSASGNLPLGRKKKGRWRGEGSEWNDVRVTIPVTELTFYLKRTSFLSDYGVKTSHCLLSYTICFFNYVTVVPIKN